MVIFGNIGGSLTFDPKRVICARRTLPRCSEQQIKKVLTTLPSLGGYGPMAQRLPVSSRPKHRFRREAQSVVSCQSLGVRYLGAGDPPSQPSAYEVNRHRETQGNQSYISSRSLLLAMSHLYQIPRSQRFPCPERAIRFLMIPPPRRASMRPSFISATASRSTSSASLSRFAQRPNVLVFSMRMTASTGLHCITQ